MSSFQEMALPETLGKALSAMGFVAPTPIQAQAIPVVMTGKDLVGSAQTGTGKTGAFCIPMFVHLSKNPGKMGVILVPTRELAQQIEVFWKQLAQYTPQLTSVTLIGGVAMGPQFRDLKRRPSVIIATPGRLMDHLQRSSIRLDQTAILVLDEADRMLDMGFAPQLTQILKYVPKVRQTLLFSATWSSSMDQLAKKYLHEPARVSVGDTGRAATKIDQIVIETTAQRKNEVLLDQINAREGTFLIFARTQARTDRLAQYLNGYGLTVNRIHGGRTQAQRNTALNDFRTGRTRILVATDIAARGIDVANIAFVINFDLPRSPDDYIHRIGRTARAGAEGQAISLVCPEDRSEWRQILRLLERSGSNAPQSHKVELSGSGAARPAAMRPQPSPQAAAMVRPAVSSGARGPIIASRGPSAAVRPSGNTAGPRIVPIIAPSLR